MKKRKIRKPITKVEIPGTVKFWFDNKNTFHWTVQVTQTTHTKTMLGLAEILKKEKNNGT